MEEFLPGWVAELAPRRSDRRYLLDRAVRTPEGKVEATTVVQVFVAERQKPEGGA